MFDLPDAKRIRRDDLLSRTSTSPSPSPPPESAIQDAHQRLGELLNLDDTFLNPSPAQVPTKQAENKDKTEADEEEEEEEFEFRLFSSAPSKKTQPSSGGQDDKRSTNGGDESQIPAQKLRIRLRSPTPTSGDLEDARFVNPFRGWQYYFTTEGLYSGSKDDSHEGEEAKMRRAQFEDVAVSGEDMFGWAKVPWLGCHLPWKVVHLKRQYTKLPAASKDVAICMVDPPVKTSPKSRKKPGKKRRIQLRKKLTAADDAKLKDAEKRNRRNREKKLKRRQKARDMKAAAVGQNQDGAAVEAGGEDSPDEGDN